MENTLNNDLNGNFTKPMLAVSVTNRRNRQTIQKIIKIKFA